MAASTEPVPASGLLGRLPHGGTLPDEVWRPNGLTGVEIPLGARIIAVCDSYDAMTSDRPYRKAMGREEALSELRDCAGAQFDPEVVKAFARAVSRRGADVGASTARWY
jgi:HD-GYP domain-containing protein (c-di-GMP phosphodiesterase class II)